ncbi:MAG: hypothetical protein KAG61_06460 [Bacteriovoracaceae bacterium]|nr:hypothetical protein [Bacteriovoracaceae bacterium]
MTKWILITLFLLSVSNVHSAVRDESDRFKLMYDRYGIDQELKGSRRYSSYFSLDIGLSSGIREIVNDISGATENTSNDIQKELNVVKVLTKNLNTEKMIFLDLITGAPLPFFKLGRVAVLPSIFFGTNVGASFTIHNSNDPLAPEAQTYIKMDKKIGFNSTLHWDTDDQVGVRLYYMIRQDIEAAASSSDIAGDGEIVGLDGLKKELKGYYTDLSYTQVNGKSSYLFEIKELLLYKDSSSTTNGNFGQRPMAHVRYRNKIKTEKFIFSPFVGMHIRDGHDFSDGAYGGIDFDFVEDIALGFTGKANGDFLTFIPRGNFNHFHVSYTLKTAFSNPQSEIWTSSIHALALSVPF